MRRALLLVFLASLVAAGTFVRAQATAATESVWQGARLLDTTAWGDIARPGATSPRLAPVAQQAAPAVASSTITLTSVLDWQRGTSTGLLVSNNAGGELRLADGSRAGTFTSELTGTKTLFNAIGAVWRAEVPQGTSLRLEVRGGPSTTEADLTPWQTLAAGDARSSDGALALESVVPFPAGMVYLQLRATLGSTITNATPVLSEIALTTLDATKGPARQASGIRSPVPYGPATLTSAPRVVLRETWGAPEPSQPIVRQTPRGVVLHLIGSDDVVDPLPFLRALAAYDIQTLGYDDMPFHFVLDRDGTIYVGRSGGPTAQVPRFSGGDAAVHVALIGGAPSSGQQSALAGLLAWLGEAYAIPPGGQHAVVSSSGQATTRPNIVAHGDIAPDAVDRVDALRALAEQSRQAADQATVRARWYFAEGNSLNFAERLAALNLSASPAQITFSLQRQPGPAVIVPKTVAAGGRADVVVNDLFNDTSDVPAIVESNAPVIAERFMNFGADITAAPGVRQLSRVWYFAEGSTEGDDKTYLILFNPQSTDATAKITYMQDDGVNAQPDDVRVPAGQRVVVTVGDALPGKRFGTRVIASQPIVAERTMVFGPGSTPSSGGVTTAPGVVTLSRRWYFAEGTTQAPFRTSILVLNPNAQPTNVKVTFLTDSGTSLDRKYAIPPATRLSIDVNEVVPALGIATTVEADRPIAAERAMYWSNPGSQNVLGMANAGATAPGFTWRFADGRTSDGFQEYLLLSNPNKNPARVSVDLVLADGKRATQVLPPLAPGSRYTMALHQYYPGQQAIAATIQSTQPIVAERALYAGAPGSEANRGGDTALGVPEELP